MTQTTVDPVIERCPCTEPGCPGYFVNNIETARGRFHLEDAKFIANRAELKALIPKIRALLRKHLLDAIEREFITYLTQLERKL